MICQACRAGGDLAKLADSKQTRRANASVQLLKRAKEQHRRCPGKGCTCQHRERK